MQRLLKKINKKVALTQLKQLSVFIWVTWCKTLYHVAAQKTCRCVLPSDVSGLHHRFMHTALNFGPEVILLTGRKSEHPQVTNYHPAVFWSIHWRCLPRLCQWSRLFVSAVTPLRGALWQERGTVVDMRWYLFKEIHGNAFCDLGKPGCFLYVTPYWLDEHSSCLCLFVETWMLEVM